MKVCLVLAVRDSKALMKYYQRRGNLRERKKSKNAAMPFSTQAPLGIWSGLSNEIQYILSTKEAENLHKLKFKVQKKIIYAYLYKNSN